MLSQFHRVKVKILNFIIKACISGLFLNETQIMFGKNNDLSEITFGQEDFYCDDHKIQTPLITIKNENVIVSSCKTTKWIRNDEENDRTENCYKECLGGKCSSCDKNGSEGYCCRRGFFDGCPDQAILAASAFHHSCVHGEFTFGG